MAKVVSTNVFELGATEWRVNAGDPRLGGGVSAPEGSWCHDSVGGSWFAKVGPLDVDWTPFALGGSATWYQDGSDGTVVLPGGTTTLTRDTFYETLTIPNGATLNPNGFRLFARTAIVIESGGAIARPGNDATSNLAAATLSAGQVAGLAGAAPGTTSTGGNVSGGSLFPLGHIPTGLGGNGGSAASAGGTVSASAGVVIRGRSFDALSLLWCQTNSSTGQFFTCATGGAGGGGSGAGNQGGGGGGAGGRLVIASPVIINEGTINVAGGNGAPGQTGNSGGGGGGGGGEVRMLCRDYSGNAPVVPGGLGGAGLGTGTAGANGNDGHWIRVAA